MFWRIVCCSILAVSVMAQDRPGPATAPAYQISGVLVDAITGQPIHHARVAIAPVTRRDGYAIMVTGEDGRFAFPNLAAGKYALNAQRRGYLAQAFNQHDHFASSIAVGPDLDSGNLVFRLPPECMIFGKVSDEAGEPVRGGQVRLYRSESTNDEPGTRLYRQGMTNEEGLYHFGHLPPGKYFVVVVAQVWYAQRPVPESQSFSEMHSDGFLRHGPNQGSYPEEQGMSPLDVAYPITFYPGVTEAGAATPIVVKSGDRFSADLSLQPVPALRIRVPATEARSGPSAGRVNNLQLHSRLFDDLPVTVPVETRLLPSGEMEVVGVPAGHYQVEMSDGRNDPKAAKSGEMEISSSGEINIEQVKSSVAVTAAVQLDPGTAVPLQGYLQLYNTRTQEYVDEQVSGAGEIEFKRPIRPGTYRFSLNNSSGEFVKTLSATGATLSGRILEINGPGPVKLNVTVARGATPVEGVALRDGKPLAGVMIVLVPSDAAHNQVLFRRDQSDSDGTFTLRSVVPGKYTLLAIENGWDLEWLNPAVLKPYLAGGEVLHVQPNGKYEVKVKVQ
jgi:protocatechuate 3,4-dioxygenase beta subunit